MGNARHAQILLFIANYVKIKDTVKPVLKASILMRIKYVLLVPL